MKIFKQGLQHGLGLLYLTPVLGFLYMIIQFYNWTS